MEADEKAFKKKKIQQREFEKIGDTNGIIADR